MLGEVFVGPNLTLVARTAPPRANEVVVGTRPDLRRSRTHERRTMAASLFFLVWTYAAFMESFRFFFSEAAPHGERGS